MGIKFQTDQSGANNNVCSSTSQTFNFSLARSAVIESADFVLKKGSGTTASIVASIYNAANGGGSVVESVTVLAANVTQLFSTIVFTFSGSTTLNAGTTYSLVVSSTTSCVGSSPYSMKTGNFQVLDSTSNTVINTGYGVDSSISVISTIASSTQQTVNATCSATVNTSITSNTNQTFDTVASIVANADMQAQGTKSRPDSPNHIRLDGRGQNQAKIYIGNKRPKIYHGNRLILDKN